jgi:alpha-galactosidase
VRNGGKGVLLGRRSIELATIVTREGYLEETPFAAAQAFCRIMSPKPRLPGEPVYGSNDWYYAYGNSSAEDILRDADLMAELAPGAGPRPYSVIDEGWENSPKFPTMPGLAAQIRSKRIHPGIWIRPLRARGEQDRRLLLPSERFGQRKEIAAENLAYDPTIPEARKKALDTVHRAAGWNYELIKHDFTTFDLLGQWGNQNYELIKHDFTTFDLLGQWGNQMGASPTLPSWSFSDRSQTNAEIIRGLYEDIRRAAGDQTVIVGCNVVGHLSAGLFELQRTGDDVSGQIWERTRRMGVNTLAFRLPQHLTFFAMDPDCVPITSTIPWPLTKIWMDVVTASGASLVISPAQGTMGTEQKEAVRSAFALAASGGSSATPANWLESRTPNEWTRPKVRENTHYEWLEPEGAYPFEV